MPAEVIDTNVLVVATATEEEWTRPRVPTDDVAVHRRLFRWLGAFGRDPDRKLVMDFPERTIFLEYRNNLPDSRLFGRRIVQQKFDTGAFEAVELSYRNNGNEQVADLPDPAADPYIHDLGDRKMVAAAFAANAPIINATDGDWTEPDVITGLQMLGVNVIELLSEEERRACRERE